MTYVIGQIVAPAPSRDACFLSLSGGVLGRHRDMTWYLARAVSRQEKRAEESLTNVGVAYYFPRLMRFERRGEQRVKVSQSLFEGYGFVGLAKDQSVFGLPKLQGFVGAVWTGKDCQPRPVSLAMIEPIVRQELNGDFDLTMDAEAVEKRFAFEDGELVRIVDGVFAGFNGSITRLPCRRRVEVLVTLFGRQSRTELPVSAIRKIA